MSADRSPALDRKESAINAWLRKKVDESLADPRPDVSADTVFKRLRALHTHRSKTMPG